MKKEAKVEYGITITKPWSKEMYDHNDQVAEIVKTKVHEMWRDAFTKLEESLEVDEEDFETEVLDLDWLSATGEMQAIQSAVTCYSFGSGYTVGDVSIEVEQEVENAAYFRLKEIAEELEIELEKGFIGLSK